MDESYLLTAIRYIEMNPVADGLVSSPEQYRWSSAKGHLDGSHDPLASPFPFVDLIPDWHDFLEMSSDEELQVLKKHESTGRPLGTEEFVSNLEQLLGRRLLPQKPGPKGIRR